MFLKHEARSSFTSVSSARRRRRLLILSVMAATALPAGLIQLPRLWAQDAAPALAAAVETAQPIGNKERLLRGIDEYKKGQYEESLADLQQVNADVLGEPDKKSLIEYLARAESAANQRKAARAEFEQGDAALAANNPTVAVAHYRAAMDNKFADEGTRAKAREQLAVADAMMRQAGQSLKDVYNQAVADFRAGNLDAAKTKFTQLESAGFKAGLFQKSPADFLKDIDRRLAQTPPAPEPVVTPAPEPAPQPPAPVVEQPAPPPAPVTEQPAPPPAPVVEQPAPPPAPVVEQPTPAPVTEVPTPAPVVETPAPEVPALDAKTAYRQAREQYRKGDWISARKNFEVARDLGYKPGLFEDSPSRFLARMDAKERRDAEIAAEEAAERAALAARTGQDAGAQAGQNPPDAATAEQRRQEAADLVVKAEEARAANRLDEAMALYARALELDPNNTSAQVGRTDLARVLGREPGAPDVLAQREQQILQQRQYITYSFQTALERARSAQDARNFTDAQAAIAEARVARSINPGIFRDEELRQFDQQLADAQLALDNSVETARLSDAERARLDAQRQLEQDRAIAEAERQRTVADLIRESRRLTQENNYKQAMGVLDQILKLDPNNDYAQGARPLVEDRAIIMEQKDYRQRYDRQVVRQYTAAEEQKVPYSDILVFPRNWPDLSAVREKTVALERGERAEDAQIAQQLERKLPEVRFDNVAFADVVEFLRDVSSANIFVNWRALEAAGIDRNAPVSARLRDVKFSKALETILRDIGGGTVRLAYTIDEGVITISTEEDLASNVVTRVYDIRDLIVNVPDFDDVPDFNISQGGGGGGGGGGSLFGSVDQGEQEGGTRAELVDSITRLIQDTVAADSWKDNGGSVGSIRELQGQLIVTQTPENQRQLVQLLEKLRETRAIQITVEARFLTVQRNFLEEIGVDFDFVLNPTGEISDNLSPISVGNNTLAYTTIGQLTTSVPGNIATELTGTGASAGGVTPNLSVTNGLGGAVTFLDDFQVSMLIRATQISQNTTTLTAPRLTLFNGQHAYVAVTTETAYVEDLTPIVGTNAVAFDPEVATINSGVLLDVQATVSADRKYVTLTLQPRLQRLRSLVPFPVTALSAGGGTNGGPTVAQTAFLQQPVVDVTVLATTVSVPDGGTLLLGGQTLAGEIERESGVPVLSKIPFLKRLFTNQAMAKDEQVLLILVKPSIVIQREREAEQFPLLGAKTGG